MSAFVATIAPEAGEDASPVSAARMLSPRQAAVEVERDALLIDLRSDDERRRQGDVPGARMTPLSRLGAQRPGRPVILLSATGRRAAAAAVDLERRGIVVAAVAGGVLGWEAAGLAVHAYRHGSIGHR